MKGKILEDMKNRIIKLINEDGFKPGTADEIAAAADVQTDRRADFEAALKELENEGHIYMTRNGKYGKPESFNLIAGKLSCKEKGFGFVLPVPGREMLKTPAIAPAKDVFIPPDAMNGAMHNDRVIASIISKDGARGRLEGEIVKVLERANTLVTGTFRKDDRYGFSFVEPDDKRIANEIYIKPDDEGGASDRQKVAVSIVEWPSKTRSLSGRVMSILGEEGDTEAEIRAIMMNYGLSREFPEDVVAQAKAIPMKVEEVMAAGRRDLRQLTTVTIDGEDAKDLDDAVTISGMKNGSYMLGVHIADVSYYVEEGSPLDKEAMKRGTSVYLPDRVIPMLPEELSNGICSLNPQKDRLAFTVMMEINKDGMVLSHEIFESIININERMTYTDVYGILQGGNKELESRYALLADDLSLMKELALILKNKRAERGAIDFDLAETKILFNSEGKPVDVTGRERNLAHGIIEEFMLVCNETVAEHFFWAEIPFVYRIHEEPDMLKIEALNEFAGTMGYHIRGMGDLHPKALQNLLAEVRGKDEEKVVSTAMLRSLQKARYSEEHEGHFGLAARYYSHFTSPIRRYPDLIIHRIMKESLRGVMNEKRQEDLVAMLKPVAGHCSERERAADNAERDADDLYKAIIMKEHLGEDFNAIISNVTSFGMYVELENTVEGLVHISSMEDDYYIFDEKNWSMTGERTGKRYRIGGKVKVRLAKADPVTRRIDFVIIDDNGKTATKGRNRKKFSAASSAGSAGIKRNSEKNRPGRPEKSGKKPYKTAGQPAKRNKTRKRGPGPKV